MTTKNSFFNKTLENKTVFLVPTGNNVRRGKESGNRFDQFVTATVVKVSRVNLILKINNHNLESKHRISDNNDSYIICGLNAGYDVFLSKNDINNELVRQKVLSKMRQISNDITAQQAIEIEKIMNW